jgi:hypothetical protein
MIASAGQQPVMGQSAVGQVRCPTGFAGTEREIDESLAYGLRRTNGVEVRVESTDSGLYPL